MKVKDIIKLCRPQQWVKNAFVLLPLFFSGQLTSESLWLETFVAFAAFCLASSAVYCFNDVADAAFDRSHPVKCNRPVASGRVSKATAIILSAVLACAAVLLPLAIGESYESAVSWVIAGYLALNVAYTYKLKQFAIIDVAVIAMGFVLRILAGGLAAGIWLSPWIVCLSFLLTMMLAVAKRRHEVMLYEGEAIKSRSNLADYNLLFLDITLAVLASVTMVGYIIYSVSPEVESRLGCEYVYVTSLFVLLGLLRYLQLTLVDRRSGDPSSILLHDRFIQCCVAAWIAVYMFIIY